MANRRRGGKLISNNGLVKVLIIISCIFALYTIKLSNLDWVTSNSFSAIDFLTIPITLQDKEEDKILRIFREANITLTAEQKQQLPSWTQITNLYGSKPRLIGTDQCHAFQQRTLVENRKLGIAGLTSTGTNLLFTALKDNCVPSPEVNSKLKKRYPKKAYKHIRWQVPWGKHDPLSSQMKPNPTIDERWEDIAGLNDTDNILHVVMIRNPYAWFSSICNRYYVIDLMPEEPTEHLKAKKRRRLPCPYLIDTETNNRSHPVTYRTRADGGPVTYRSLAHVWNDWNGDYMETTNHTRIMVRMEDLVFHTYQIVKEICECVGLMIRTDQPFQYQEQNLKKKHKGSTGLDMVGVWAKFGSPPPPRGGLVPEQYDAAIQYLDPSLMNAFGYHHPPSN